MTGMPQTNPPHYLKMRLRRTRRPEAFSEECTGRARETNFERTPGQDEPYRRTARDFVLALATNQ